MPETFEDDLPTGVVETACPETGECELMGFWLPPEVTAADLGLVRVLMMLDPGEVAA